MKLKNQIVELLHLICQRGHIDIVEYLINKNTCLESKNILVVFEEPFLHFDQYLIGKRPIVKQKDVLHLTDFVFFLFRGNIMSVE